MIASFVQPIGMTEATKAGITLPKSPLFGTDGIRGKVGDLLTAPLALQVGFWAGKVWQEAVPAGGTVIVGQDSRNSSEMLAAALTAGLTAAGLNVWQLGLCPTPAVAYLTQALGAIGGVMISASHNPPEDNGIKFFGADGVKLPKAQQQKIEVYLREHHKTLVINGSRAATSHQRPELVDAYMQSLRASLATTGLADDRPLQGLRIVLDLAWGAAVRTAPALFEALGAEVICLHPLADGDRINVNCGSTHLAVLQAAVLEQVADMGFAFDGDADRVLAVDAQGRAVDGDYILYFWGRALQQADQLPHNTIVSTVMANLGFERAWNQLGGVLLRTPVGDQYVHAEMMRTGAVLGGEQSGHILCSHYGISGDGLLTAIHLAGLVKQQGTSLASLMNQSFQPYPQLLKNVRVDDRERRLNWQSCDALQTAIASAEAAMGDQGRVLVRASGTEPVIRVMVEAADADLAHYWTDSLVATLQHHLLA